MGQVASMLQLLVTVLLSLVLVDLLPSSIASKMRSVSRNAALLVCFFGARLWAACLKRSAALRRASGAVEDLLAVSGTVMSASAPTDVDGKVYGDMLINVLRQVTAAAATPSARPAAPSARPAAPSTTALLLAAESDAEDERLSGGEEEGDQ